MTSLEKKLALQEIFAQYIRSSGVCRYEEGSIGAYPSLELLFHLFAVGGICQTDMAEWKGEFDKNKSFTESERHPQFKGITILNKYNYLLWIR